MEGADVLVIITEWNEFRALDVAHVKSLLRAPVVVDLCNIHRLEKMADACFAYDSVGRPVVASAAVAMLNVVSASPRVQK